MARGITLMLRRMVLPTVAAAIVVGALGFAYESWRTGDGLSATFGSAFAERERHDRHDRD